MSAGRKARLDVLPGWSWDPITEQWENGFRHLKEFAESEGHSKVSQDYESPDGYQLGQWVTGQRGSRLSMPTARRQLLENLPGWAWDARQANWEEGFRYLKEFTDREGHSRVPAKYMIADGYRLGQWLYGQKDDRSIMPQDRRERFEALPGWAWNVIDEQWEDGFRQLQKFAEREGHCSMPALYKTEDGYRLGRWVSQQRSNRDIIPMERRERLEALSGWTWDARADRWEEGFRHLKEFVDREGHSKVNQGFLTSDGYHLGQWIGVQRTTRDSMTAERKERLEALPGWTWEARAEQWEEGFNRLKNHIENGGNCLVARSYKTADGYSLGGWIHKQRGLKDRMNVERKVRLEALPGWVWHSR